MMSDVQLIERPYRVTAAEFEALPATAVELERREAIRDLAAKLFTVDLEGTGHERVHVGDPLAEPVIRFTRGIYAREYSMPAGMRLVGMRHKQEHLNIISLGHATVMTEDGQTEVFAGDSFVAPAGTQRVLIVHEYTRWTTIHRTDKTTPEEAFEDLFIDETELIAPRVKLLGGAK
jgi:mannose-6-phosphate isomerase-like protein (cupin superfamily)